MDPEFAKMTNEEARTYKMETYTKERDDLTTPTKLTAGYILSNLGTDLDAIEPFTSELTGIVDKMKEELAAETRILEGTSVPEYTPLPQNELSQGETKEDQWKSVLPNGFSTIDRILTSTPVSSSSSCSARPNSPASDTPGYDVRCCTRSNVCCRESSDASGCETGTMNECSECTVPTISEPTPGTPSEAK